jgi:hypothetical protein
VLFEVLPNWGNILSSANPLSIPYTIKSSLVARAGDLRDSKTLTDLVFDVAFVQRGWSCCVEMMFSMHLEILFHLFPVAAQQILLLDAIVSIWWRKLIKIRNFFKRSLTVGSELCFTPRSSIFAH